MYPEVAVDRSADPFLQASEGSSSALPRVISPSSRAIPYSGVDWFRAIARYTRWWGWYIISTEEVPADLPEGITPIQLPWELVGQEDGNLKPEHLVKEAVRVHHL